MRPTLLLVVALVCQFSAAPVCACINDMDTFKQERQFKSLYPDDAPVSPGQEPQTETPALLTYGGSGAGIVLLATAGFLGFVRRRTV